MRIYSQGACWKLMDGKLVRETSEIRGVPGFLNQPNRTLAEGRPDDWISPEG